MIYYIMDIFIQVIICVVKGDWVLFSCHHTVALRDVRSIHHGADGTG